MVDQMFSPRTINYSISDNILSMTHEYEGETDTEIYKKIARSAIRNPHPFICLNAASV